MSYNAVNKYKQNTIKTATPEELTLMLYEGAIKFMNIAIVSIEKEDITKKHESLLRAQSIITELRATLNPDIEISKELDNLYDFILTKLVEGNISNDTAAIEDALNIAYDLRDTWKEVMQQVKQNAYQAR